MSAHGSGNARIRQVAWSEFIQPLLDSGKTQLAVAIKPLMKRLEAEGFPKNRPRQFCTALQKGSFLEEKGLVLDRVEGPPSGTSTTVVLHFRMASPTPFRPGCDGYNPPSSSDTHPISQGSDPLLELQGLLKGAIAEGARAFLQELRRDPPNAA